MAFELQTATWVLIADWTIRIAALLWVPVRSPPAAARSWLLLVGFVPLLGLPHWELLRHDNCPHENHLPGLLGHAPRTVGAIASPAGHDVAMPVDGTPA